MSSSAFFIEAAANTVTLLSCAAAGGMAAPTRTSNATKIPERRFIDGAPCRLLRAFARANQALAISGCDMRKRRSGNPLIDAQSVGMSLAAENIRMTDGVKPAW